MGRNWALGRDRACLEGDGMGGGGEGTGGGWGED
jgi:hypothetical protein